MPQQPVGLRDLGGRGPEESRRLPQLVYRPPHVRVRAPHAQSPRTACRVPSPAAAPHATSPAAGSRCRHTRRALPTLPLPSPDAPDAHGRCGRPPVSI
ncbi:hypothetical protein BDA96_02G387600 [Sorghum bicolor]|uniref:Uncharacterized protein n=1 Tax=Sorghum bicolor TaxID=4558 RepID=A0A921RTS1_SORBI|nr:hypothetical protein BDA96_02G387600 [Sorghum bicolor]